MIHDNPIINKEATSEKKFNHLFIVILSLLIILAMYGLPVYGAFLIASFIEQMVQTSFISHLENLFHATPAFFKEIAVGPYGLFTLGFYSFIWAFPVVVLISLSISITSESGIKDRLTIAIDPVLRKVGLTGRDIIPIITGYGCNVVAVYQSKGCSACTRKQCLSMISFGSACSYQVGASLSLFSVAGKPWMFIPYIIALWVIGILHTKIWYPQRLINEISMNKSVILRKPNYRKVMNSFIDSIKQFFFQALPVFLIICIISTILHSYKLLEFFSRLLEPILALFSLPAEASLGIIFSILRKDGILLFYEGNGSMLLGLSSMELFVLVYIASTFSSCLVTLFAIGKDVSRRFAGEIAIKQMVTSTASAFIFIIMWKLIS